MVTVILIGAALTSVTTIAAYSTIKDFQSGTDDRKAAEALSYAEAGVDRFVQYLRDGRDQLQPSEQGRMLQAAACTSRRARWPEEPSPPR